MHRNLKLLNLQRWQEQVDAQASTGGALFNRSNPQNDGKFVQPYNRETDKQEPMRGNENWVSPQSYQRVRRPPDADRWQATRSAVPQQGADFTSVGVASVNKYRIPVTSVTRKEGDLKLFCCLDCGWRLTAVLGWG